MPSPRTGVEANAVVGAPVYACALVALSMTAPSVAANVESADLPPLKQCPTGQSAPRPRASAPCIFPNVSTTGTDSW